ncbi:oligosaccharide flippase family protein, partial [Providencia sp. Me1]|uniref:oligosaccharide flippase family protein n=1 Tax=Providencia sp. Me1 TaxID=3392634 RepID=UPI003D2C288E
MKTGGIALLKKNLTLGLLTRLFSLLLTYVSIPIVLNYLGAESYGFWIILFTGISWIYNFDMGVGLGLKNQLTEAIIEKNDTKCSEIISTAYAIIIFITLIMLIISLLLLNYLDIKKILAINFLSKEYINNIILITISFAYLNFIIGLYKQLFQSINLSGAVGISSVLIQLAIIISIIIASKLTESSLYITTIIYGLANFTFGSIYTFFFFYKRKRIKLN